ncbi:hypothetical protein ACIBSR_06045 [Streptomyces sp. NPDC049936]|uniref:hypothetical protein n=1 Tax=Streptomyces sp. NPDC049936 TaxID=3365599 RepID=UPI0037B70D02
MTHGLVLKTFPAGSPRGSWPAEEFASHLRVQGRTAEVVMDLAADAFLVVAPATTAPSDTRGNEAKPQRSAA